MTVREMLSCVGANELAEYRAYEYLNGPIGPAYEQQTLAAIHEQLQLIVMTLRQANAKDPDDVPGVVLYPRPNEVYKLGEE
jgi:hypothetical protein